MAEMFCSQCVVRIVTFLSLGSLSAVIFAAAPNEREAGGIHIKPTRPPAGATKAPVLRVGSNLVLVPVSVLDLNGTPVRGLPREAFHILEAGKERSVESFTEEEGPVSIGIVFDASRSMETKLGQSRTALARVSDLRLPGDEYLAVAFSDLPRVICNLTTDVDHVRAALGSIVAGGWTSLYDGIYLSASLMRKAANSRRALLVLSDGEDNFSRYGSSELRRFLREAGVTVYAIGLTGSGLSAWRGRTLRRLTEETGGWFLPVEDTGELHDAVAGMSRTIRSHYVIGIRPSERSAETGKYTQIQVKVDPPGGEPLRVSWRNGYYGVQ